MQVRRNRFFINLLKSENTKSVFNKTIFQFNKQKSSRLKSAAFLFGGVKLKRTRFSPRPDMIFMWQGFALAIHRSSRRHHFWWHQKVTKMRCYAFFLPSAKFVMIPRISAHATAVIVILPKLSVRPPIPEIRITETVKRFLLSSRSTV